MRADKKAPSRRSPRLPNSDQVMPSRDQGAQAARRDHAPQTDWSGNSGLAAMPAMVLVVVMVPRPSLFSAVHGDAARLAQLRMFGLHAGGDLGHVRNDVGAQSHGVRCASLPFSIGALRIRAADAVSECTGEDRQHADRTKNPHHHDPCPQRMVAPRRRRNLAGARGAVDSGDDESSA